MDEERNDVYEANEETSYEVDSKPDKKAKSSSEDLGFLGFLIMFFAGLGSILGIKELIGFFKKIKNRKEEEEARKKAKKKAKKKKKSSKKPKDIEDVDEEESEDD